MSEDHVEDVRAVWKKTEHEHNGPTDTRHVFDPGCRMDFVVNGEPLSLHFSIGVNFDVPAARVTEELKKACQEKWGEGEIFGKPGSNKWVYLADE